MLCRDKAPLTGEKFVCKASEGGRCAQMASWHRSFFLRLLSPVHPSFPSALPSTLSKSTKKHVLLDEMRKITRAAKDQESRLRADLREVQRKLEAEQKYAEKVREEREELRQAVKRHKVELGSMEAKVKTLEADVAKKTEDLRVQVTDAIQREVEKCTRKYVESLDGCFPGATYIFECDEDDSPVDADHGEVASQHTQNSAKQRLQSAASAADGEDESA